MTPPGGSGRGAGGGPPGRDDAGHDEETGGDGDPKLAAMRSVWLSMRDEEPPGRGMAELLAAARVKAEAMAPKPRWWQRLAALLRRPPMLALATALVLIGGAVLLGRRLGEDGMPERQKVTAVRAPAAVSGSPAASRPPTVSLPAGAAAAGDASTATAAPARGDAGAVGGAGASGTGASGAKTSGTAHSGALSDRAGATGAGEGRAGTGGAGLDGVDASGAATGSPERDGTAAETAQRVGAERDDAARASGGARPQAPVTRPPAAPAAPRREAPPDMGLVTRLGSAASARRVLLYQQCEAAARRGDCAAVRRLVEQISQTDPGYRARMVQDTAFARCLE